MADWLSEARYRVACWTHGMACRLENWAGSLVIRQHERHCSHLRRRWRDRSPF